MTSWNDAFFKKCTHQTLDEIKNGYDKTIGMQCLNCMELIWSLGRCDGCHKDNSKLHLVINIKEGIRNPMRRFCDETCRKKYKPSTEWKGNFK
jgi:hypothetical protein